jgi:riboflavin kinase/FMN adenylyltransferase
VRARIGGRVVDGVASFGRRPTFDDGAPLLEVFLFDFSGDLYGETINVAFLGWLRREQKFESIEALTRQMNADAAQAREVLARSNAAFPAVKDV